jgi:non-ribosomal peptide synthetase component E (peptide arylation enzyme)
MSVTFYVIVVAAIAAGLTIGAGTMVIARRSAPTHEQAVRRQRIVQAVALVVVAAMLIFDAVDTPRHRYFDLAIVAIMAAGVAFDWFRARRRRTGS